MKRKLVIIESANSLGKTTISKLLAQKIDADIIQQPSPNNKLGYLRRIVKEEIDIDPFPRQLLHSISHIVDLYENMLMTSKNIVMDRCYISALVYGELSGLNKFQLSLIYDIHKKLYCGIDNVFDIYLFILVRNQPFLSKSDSIYEPKLQWHDINHKYRKVVECVDYEYYFSTNEKIGLIDLQKIGNLTEIIKYISTQIKRE